jgi:biopolymer transport protein ExbD
MRWGLLAVRLGIIAVNIVIALIIILAVVPLATGGLDVNVPSSNESSWTLDGQVLHLSAPVSVHNGGFYDIEDFSLRMQVVDESGNEIMDDRSIPANLRAGKTTPVPLVLSLDIGNVSQEAKRKIVFEGASYNISLSIEARYIMKLMKLGIAVEDEMRWDPLINEYRIDQSQIRYEYSGSQIVMIVPYYISTSQMVYGYVINVTSEVRNSNSVLGTGSAPVPLTPSLNGKLRELPVVLSQEAYVWLATHSGPLTINLRLDFMGASAEESVQYYWNAPP